eukprot:284819116_2
MSHFHRRCASLPSGHLGGTGGDERTRTGPYKRCQRGSFNIKWLFCSSFSQQFWCFLRQKIRFGGCWRAALLHIGQTRFSFWLDAEGDRWFRFSVRLAGKRIDRLAHITRCLPRRRTLRRICRAYLRLNSASGNLASCLLHLLVLGDLLRGVGTAQGFPCKLKSQQGDTSSGTHRVCRLGHRVCRFRLTCCRDCYFLGTFVHRSCGSQSHILRKRSETDYCFRVLAVDVVALFRGLKKPRRDIVRRRALNDCHTTFGRIASSRAEIVWVVLCI